MAHSRVFFGIQAGREGILLLPFSCGENPDSSWQNYGLLAGHSENNVTKKRPPRFSRCFHTPRTPPTRDFFHCLLAMGITNTLRGAIWACSSITRKTNYHKRYTAALLSHFTKEKDGGWNTGLWPLFKLDREYEEAKAGRELGLVSFPSGLSDIILAESRIAAIKPAVLTGGWQFLRMARKR